MSDFALVHRPALGAVKAISSAQITLTPLPEGTVLQIFASDASAFAVSANASGLSVRVNGPGQWYLVGDEPGVRLTEMPANVTVTDQSHGRVRIGVEGPSARDVLAKGTGLDLSTFNVGNATTTLFGHISAHITCTDLNAYELMPLRGFAESLWHDLERMSAEFL